MANLGYVSTFNINGNELTLKDAALTEIVSEIIEAIGANNTNIAERINDLHNRSFDNTIKISSQNESEIASIQDGLYKIQYVTVTGEGDNATETLNNSAILIQDGTNQYLYKDGQLSSRTKANSTWGAWITFEGGVTSVNGQTGAVTVNVGVTSFNGSTGAVIYTAPVTSVNGQTGEVGLSIPSKTSDLTNDSNFIKDKGGNGLNLNTSVIDGAFSNEDIVLTCNNHNAAVNVNPGGINIISNWDGSSIGVNNNGTSNVNINTSQGKAYYNNKEIATVDQIPAAVTEDTVWEWGFTKDHGTYSKPLGGIPKTDLASAVQTSLEKADTALQSYTETDPTVQSWAKKAISFGESAYDGELMFSANIFMNNWLTNGYVINLKNRENSAVTNIYTSSNIISNNGETWDRADDYSLLTAKAIKDKIDIKYTKPSTGIPASDLAAGVIPDVPVQSVNGQTGAVSLALGDTNVIETIKVNNTALTPVSKAVNITVPTKVSDLTNDSNFTSNTGTITGITMNGVSKGTSGVVNLGTVLTEHQDISGKVDKVTGMGLSSNDYTTTEKNKLAGINIGSLDSLTTAELNSIFS